jgi:hypothetical protein
MVVRADLPVKMMTPVVPEETLVAMKDVLMAEMTAVISEAEGDAIRTGRRTGKPDHGGGDKGEGEGP